MLQSLIENVGKEVKQKKGLYKYKKLFHNFVATLIKSTMNDNIFIFD